MLIHIWRCVDLSSRMLRDVFNTKVNRLSENAKGGEKINGFKVAAQGAG